MAFNGWTEEDKIKIREFKDAMVELISGYYDLILDGKFEEANQLIQTLFNSMENIEPGFLETPMGDIAEMHEYMALEAKEEYDDDYYLDDSDEDEEDGS